MSCRLHGRWGTGGFGVFTLVVGVVVFGVVGFATGVDVEAIVLLGVHAGFKWD
jgi:uncharacterized protein YqhQ